MSKQNEVTAADVVIEQYAIENARLRYQNATLQLELGKLQKEEDHAQSISKD